MRHDSRAVESRPTSSRPAPLLLAAHRYTGSTSRDHDDERAPRAASTSFLVRAPPTSSSAYRSRRRAPRAPCCPHRRAPTNVITPSVVAALCPLQRRLHEPKWRRRASAEPRARRSFLERRRSNRWRALVVSSGAVYAALAAPPSADLRHHAQLRCRSLPIATPASRALTTKTSKRRAASVPIVPRAPPVKPLARARPFVGRRVRRVGCAAERRPTSLRPAPLLPTANKCAGYSNRYDDGERAPSCEHVVS